MGLHSFITKMEQYVDGHGASKATSELYDTVHWYLNFLAVTCTGLQVENVRIL